MQQIRAAYVSRARQAHPDLVGGKGLDVMRALNEAWAILKDAARKTAWDREHRPAGAFGGGGAESNRPYWTGAMGPPPGRPSGTVLHFGIYDGWSIGEIARQDRGYLIWLRDRPEARDFRAEVLRLLNPDADEPKPGRSFGRR